MKAPKCERAAASGPSTHAQLPQLLDTLQEYTGLWEADVGRVAHDSARPPSDPLSDLVEQKDRLLAQLTERERS